MEHREDDDWLDYRQRFAGLYDGANYASPLQRRVMRASHRLLEKRFGAAARFGRVLEVGAGTGEHLPFVRHAYDEYVVTDRDPEALRLAERKATPVVCGKVRFEAHAAENLGFADAAFDRLVAAHVLEHLYPPQRAIKEWRRVLRDGGTLSVLIPTDPGVAWRLGRALGPRRAAVAQGLPYDYIIAREHVNACNNLLALLRYYFPEHVDDWWPLPFATIDGNLFYAFHAIVRK